MKRAYFYSGITLCAFLFSFAPEFGAENFEIYVNNKLVVQQFVTRQMTPASFVLDETTAKGEISVYYNHCGRIGKSRSITIRNEANRTLKTLTFTDAIGSTNIRMNFIASDLTAFFKTGNSKLSLIYSAKELPEGRTLASITFLGSTARKQ